MIISFTVGSCSSSSCFALSLFLLLSFLLNLLYFSFLFSSLVFSSSCFSSSSSVLGNDIQMLTVLLCVKLLKTKFPGSSFFILFLFSD